MYEFDVDKEFLSLDDESLCLMLMILIGHVDSLRLRCIEMERKKGHKIIQNFNEMKLPWQQYLVANSYTK